MSDISKCFGKECPIKTYCYRYTAKADPHRQSYGAFDKSFTDKHCNYYLPSNSDISQEDARKEQWAYGSGPVSLAGDKDL